MFSILRASLVILRWCYEVCSFDGFSLSQLYVSLVCISNMCRCSKSECSDELDELNEMSVMSVMDEMSLVSLMSSEMCEMKFDESDE